MVKTYDVNGVICIKLKEEFVRVTKNDKVGLMSLRHKGKMVVLSTEGKLISKQEIGPDSYMWFNGDVCHFPGRYLDNKHSCLACDKLAICQCHLNPIAHPYDESEKPRMAQLGIMEVSE